MRAAPLVRLTLLFVGLAALFAGLNLVARGHPGVAAVASASGAAAAGVAAWALTRRDGGAADPGPGEADRDGDAPSGAGRPGDG